jgi:hypothetical protein
MIEVKIPTEIKKFREVAFFGLSYRRAISLAVAFLISVLTFWISTKYLKIVGWNNIMKEVTNGAISYVIIPIMLVGGIVGYFEYNGMMIEKFAKSWWNYTFGQRHRVYESTNLYDILGSTDDNKKGGK